MFCANEVATLYSNLCRIILVKLYYRPSQWPRGLMRGSAAARLLGFCVRIPAG